MTTQKASVAKMSLLIFITEPKSWGFSPIQLSLDVTLSSSLTKPGTLVAPGFFVLCHPGFIPGSPYTLAITDSSY